MRVIPTGNAIDESVDLAHEICNRVFRKVKLKTLGLLIDLEVTKARGSDFGKEKRNIEISRRRRPDALIAAQFVEKKL